MIINLSEEPYVETCKHGVSAVTLPNRAFVGTIQLNLLGQLVKCTFGTLMFDMYVYMDMLY